MKKIYVGNLPYSVNEDELKEIFSQFGTIEDFVMINDRETGRFKGFGFIEFDSQAAAEAALSMDGKDHGGRPLKVNMAKERTERGGGGRSGGGGGGGRW